MFLLLALLSPRALPADSVFDRWDVPLPEPAFDPSGSDPDVAEVSRWFRVAAPDPEWAWTIDYRFRCLTNSHTTYEFGTPELPPDGWTPLSRLKFNIDSLWHGAQIGLKRPNWGVHFEYLVPAESGIHGSLEDYDWNDPGAGFTDLGVASQRWIEGRMLDVGAEFLLCQQPVGLPLEVWPLAGFRWQRLDLMCYGSTQYKEEGHWPVDPYRNAGDVLSLNQEYSAGYVGTQLRTSLTWGRLPPLRLVFQGDWAYTEGRNADHHLLREGDRYTFEKTHGGTWHAGVTAEMPVRRWLTVGCQVDYVYISTTGTHRLLNEPFEIDMAWTHGVRVWSDQTWLTAFVRVNW